MAKPGDGLGGLIAGLGSGSKVELHSGTCAYSDGKWRVSRGGQELTSLVWLESASPRTGPCLLAIDTAPGGQSIVYVLGFTFPQEFRANDVGTVTADGSFGTCTVQLRDGTEYAGARYMSHYVPKVNDMVMILWKGGEAYVMGGFPNGHNTVRTPMPPALPELPRAVTSGASHFPTLGFRLWDGASGAWVKERGREVRLSPNRSAVFVYGGMTKGLQKQYSVESVTLTLGTRATAGKEDAVTLEVYRSDAETTNMATNPTNQEGPYTVVVPADYHGQPLDLPIDLGEALKQGGGITLEASSNITFRDSPANGFINIKWRNK